MFGMASEWAQLVRTRVMDGVQAGVKVNAQQGLGFGLGVAKPNPNGPALEGPSRQG